MKANTSNANVHQRLRDYQKGKMWLNPGRVLDSLKPNLPRRLGTAAKDLGSGLCSNKTQTLPPFFPTLASTSRQALEPRCLQADVVMLGLRISEPRADELYPPALIVLGWPMVSLLQTHLNMRDPHRCEHATSLRPLRVRRGKIFILVSQRNRLLLREVGLVLWSCARM